VQNILLDFCGLEERGNPIFVKKLLFSAVIIDSIDVVLVRVAVPEPA